MRPAPESAPGDRRAAAESESGRALGLCAPGRRLREQPGAQRVYAGRAARGTGRFAGMAGRRQSAPREVA